MSELRQMNEINIIIFNNLFNLLSTDSNYKKAGMFSFLLYIKLFFGLIYRYSLETFKGMLWWNITVWNQSQAGKLLSIPFRQKIRNTFACVSSCTEEKQCNYKRGLVSSSRYCKGVLTSEKNKTRCNIIPNQ